MATASEIIDKIINQSSAILNTDTNKLASNYRNQEIEQGIPFQVTEISSQLDDVKEILKFISRESLSELPLYRLVALNDSIRNVFACIERLSNFKFSQQTPYQEQAREFIDFFKHTSDQHKWIKTREYIWPIIIEAIVLLNNKLSLEGGLGAFTKIQNNLKESEEIKKSLDNILNATRDEISEKGISKHSQIFTNQAVKHKTNSQIWGVVSLLFTLANAGMIILLYNLILRVSNEKLIVLSVLSILLVSLASYLLVLFVRNYFAEKHNEVINTHKANCLSSYNTFIESASDEVKGIVLQYTTQTIFSSFSPGYLNKDSIQSPVPLVEIIRAAKKTTDSQ